MLQLKNGTLFNNDVVIADNYNYYDYLNDNFIQYGKNGKHFLVDKKNNREIEVPQALFSLGFDGKKGFYTENYIYDKELERSRCDLFRFNISTRTSTKILSNSAEILRLVENKNLFLYLPSTTLKSLSLLTGEYEWEADLGGRKYLDFSQEKTAEIRHIVGVWENLLVVTMTHNEVVSIDIETGNILWETKDLLKKHLQNDNSGKWRSYLENCHLENGKLYELTSSIYYSIDLQTQKVEILWQDKRERDYVTVVHTTYTENYIYFTGSYNNRFQPHLLGVFNRRTLQIDWAENMDLSIDPKLGYVASLNQAPQVSEDKLYVLDSGGTLHIFEKEK
jgi:outer membrane protein assembly factor BamB